MKVLIVDDEPLARERLGLMVAALGGYRVVEPSAGDGAEALALAEHFRPDVVLLDIGMPGLDGLQVAARLCEQAAPPAVIFCTDNFEFNSEAFRISEIEHLVKPICSAHLDDALKKAKRLKRVQLTTFTRPAAESGLGPRSHISARTHRGIELIPLDDVIYFIADQKYVVLHHQGGELLLDESLKSLENEFGDRFLRIHRNALVARDRLERLHRTSSGELQLYLRGQDDAPMAVSRRHAACVRKIMNHLELLAG